jgi:thymidine phosphorylase
MKIKFYVLKDVKIGRAAFMKSQSDAELLADYMVSKCEVKSLTVKMHLNMNLF